MAKILIIGGGVSGLSCGIYAQLAGHNAVICEKTTTPGGNLTGWDRDGYHIDNCIHWLCGTNPRSASYRMWQELGVLGGVPIRQGESLYTVEFAGRRLSLYCDLEKLEREMTAISTEDKREIRSLMRGVRAAQRFIGAPNENGSTGTGLFTRAAAVPALHKYYLLTAGELALRFKHPLIRRFLTALLTEKFGALGLIVVMADYCAKNAGIPAGGSTAMAGRLTARFESLGGTLLTGREAVRINMKGDRAVSVRFADGTEITADYFVSAADPSAVFGKLIDRPMPPQLARLYRNKRLVCFSSWHCAFACDQLKLPFTGDFILKLPPEHASAAEGGNIALREFSHEPSFAPEGKSILQTLGMLNAKKAKALAELGADPGAYRCKKAELASIAGEAIIKTFPELAGKLRLLDCWTPKTYRRYFGSDIGAYMSFAFSSRVLPLPVGCRVPGIENLVLATQWQQPPGGLPIAASAGKRAAERICLLARRESVAGQSSAYKRQLRTAVPGAGALLYTKQAKIAKRIY